MTVTCTVMPVPSLSRQIAPPAFAALRLPGRGAGERSVLVQDEVALARTADRTEPGLGNVLERRSRRDSAVGIAVDRVVDESAGLADPLLRRFRCAHARKVPRL